MAGLFLIGFNIVSKFFALAACLQGRSLFLKLWILLKTLLLGVLVLELMVRTVAISVALFI